MSKEQFQINFGPQHPAAHGVLRLILTLSGEKIIKRDPHIGLLHRGTEKLIEYKTILQSIAYFDRLDYVSMLSQEHSFIVRIEKILNIEISEHISYIRIIFLELTRILNHLMSITTNALDVGAITPFLWGFEEREKIMEFYEQISGARMHANFFRVNSISKPPTKELITSISLFVNSFLSRIFELEDLLLGNPIWMKRLKNVGNITKEQVLQYGCTGIIARSVGYNIDLRNTQPYEKYPSFIPIVTQNGDCFDRVFLRLQEMKQSVMFINYCINLLDIHELEYLFTPELVDMEGVISHFKAFSTGHVLQKTSLYCRTESPKGEFGVFLICNNTNRLFRCKIRSPDYFHLQVLPLLLNNVYLRDLVTILGAQDIVFGSIDR